MTDILQLGIPDFNSIDFDSGQRNDVSVDVLDMFGEDNLGLSWGQI